MNLEIGTRTGAPSGSPNPVQLRPLSATAISDPVCGWFLALTLAKPRPA